MSGLLPRINAFIALTAFLPLSAFSVDLSVYEINQDSAEFENEGLKYLVIDKDNDESSFFEAVATLKNHGRKKTIEIIEKNLESYPPGKSSSMDGVRRVFLPFMKARVEIIDRLSTTSPKNALEKTILERCAKYAPIGYSNYWEDIRSHYDGNETFEEVIAIKFSTPEGKPVYCRCCISNKDANDKNIIANGVFELSLEPEIGAVFKYCFPYDGKTDAKLASEPRNSESWKASEAMAYTPLLILILEQKYSKEVEKKDFDAAIEVAQKILQISRTLRSTIKVYDDYFYPDLPSTCLRTLGRTYTMKGDISKAEASYKDALLERNAPNSEDLIDANNSLSEIYLKQGKLKEAAESCQNAFDSILKCSMDSSTELKRLGNNIKAIEQAGYQGKLASLKAKLAEHGK